MAIGKLLGRAHCSKRILIRQIPGEPLIARPFLTLLLLLQLKLPCAAFSDVPWDSLSGKCFLSAISLNACDIFPLLTCSFEAPSRCEYKQETGGDEEIFVKVGFSSVQDNHFKVLVAMYASSG